MAAAIAMVAAAGIAAYGSHKAGQKQKQSGDAALDLAREQEATRKSEWDAAQTAEKQAYETSQANELYDRQESQSRYEDSQSRYDSETQYKKQQYERELARNEATLAPYRQARMSVLGMYGIGGGQPAPQVAQGAPQAPQGAPQGVPQAGLASINPAAAAALQGNDPQVAGQVIDGGVTAADLNAWSEWKRYGVGQGA